MTDFPDRRVVLLEAELRRVRGDLERTLDAMPPERIHRAPGPGGWSPAQLVWHLAKVERGTARLLERLDAALAPMATVPPGPRTDALLKMLDQYAHLDRTRKFVAPEGLKPPATVDYIAERGRLADGRAQLLDIVRQAGPRLSLHRFDHTFIGPLDGWQWTLFIARHEERHHAQLVEILAAPA